MNYLAIETGTSTLHIDLYKVMDKNYCRITCTTDYSDTQDDDLEWIEEINCSTILLNKDNVDKIINKLNEIKSFLI